MLAWSERGRRAVTFGICAAFVSLVMGASLPPCGSADCRHVFVDPDHPITITYRVSKEDTARLPCDCSLERKMFVTGVYLHSENGVHNISGSMNTRLNSFNVSLPVVGTGDILPGLYNYRISYNYTCLDDTGRSKCPENSTCTDIELVVEIVDYMLKLVGSKSNQPVIDSKDTNSTVATYNEKIGSKVPLICSSGLNGSDESSLSLPALFVFWKNSSELTSNTNYTKSMECNNTTMGNVTNGNWAISRQTTPPYDCMLTITDFTADDVGKYNCAGMLPESNSHFEKDWSNSPININSTEQPVSYLVYILGIVVTVVIVIIISSILIITLIVRLVRPRPPPHRTPTVSPQISLLSHRSLQQNYGATEFSSSTCIAIEPDNETETTLTGTTDPSPALITPLSLPSTPPLSPSPPPLSSSPPNLPSPSTTPDIVPFSPPPALSDPQEKPENEYENEGPKTPETTGNKTDLDSLIPSHHGMSIPAVSMNEHGASESGDGAPKVQGHPVPSPPLSIKSDSSSDNESNPSSNKKLSSDEESTISNESTISGKSDTSVAVKEGVGIYNSYFPQDESSGSRSDGDGKKQHGSLKSGSTTKDKGGLTIDDESKNGSARPRTESATSAAVKEGTEHYNDFMKVTVPGDEPTPEDSEYPVDENFKCLQCGKIYHKDQIGYFKRHVESLCEEPPDYESLDPAESTSGSSSGQSSPVHESETKEAEK